MKKPTRKDPPRAGPLETYPWPTQLPARVVTPGANPRVHGYSVEDDLARHYSYADSLFVCLVGDLPDRSVGRAFEIAMQWLGPIAVTEAPSHAAVLAKLLRSKRSAVLGTAAVALGEAVHHSLLELSPVMAWLERPTGPFPSSARADGGEDRASVTRLRSLLEPTGISSPAFAHDPSRLAALVATLHACGLTEAEQIEVAVVTARLPFVMAEAMAAPARDLRGYPMNAPGVRYREGDDGEA